MNGSAPIDDHDDPLAPATWLCLAFFRRGRVQLAAQLLIATILLASVAGIQADGSVRSGASMAMVAAVVAAGTFLRRRYMLAAAGFALKKHQITD